ncbi:hypothetical protein [Streptomyces regalis]|uniref:hypothetical protein n=1 Tax=Streptomyces regalis TaxID=68262 RepID=UPI000AE5D921|nr:hypothetical protein [Streptomyces regalis]
MRWLLLGALLALMLLFPALGAVVLGTVTAAVSKPLVVAFALGLAAGLRLRRTRGWTR